MKNKFWRDPVILFALRFAVIFGLLILPWPGWNDMYASYFRGLGQTAFTRDVGKQAVTFAPYPDSADARGLDTLITLSNRDRVEPDGKRKVEKSGLDTRSIGWVPTALTVALILATPIPWRRRGWALVGGLVLVHLFILFSLKSWIWNNSPDVSLLTLSPFEKEVADDLDYTLIDQLGASFAVPVLIWILVTFNSHDLPRRELEKAKPHGHALKTSLT